MKKLIDGCHGGYLTDLTMPKKPKKIRIGGRVWHEQRARDTQHYQDNGPPPPPPQKPQQEWGYKKARWTRDDWDSEAEARRAAEEARRAAGARQQAEPPKCSPVRRTHLRTLGLTPAEDSLPEIKKAYRTLARRLHPDKNPAADATDLMKVANAAYEFLTKEGTD